MSLKTDLRADGNGTGGVTVVMEQPTTGDDDQPETGMVTSAHHFPVRCGQSPGASGGPAPTPPPKAP